MPGTGCNDIWCPLTTEMLYSFATMNVYTENKTLNQTMAIEAVTKPDVLQKLGSFCSWSWKHSLVSNLRLLFTLSWTSAWFVWRPRHIDTTWKTSQAAIFSLHQQWQFHIYPFSVCFKHHQTPTEANFWCRNFKLSKTNNPIITPTRWLSLLLVKFLSYYHHHFFVCDHNCIIHPVLPLPIIAGIHLYCEWTSVKWTFAFDLRCEKRVMMCHSCSIFLHICTQSHNHFLSQSQNPPSSFSYIKSCCATLNGSLLRMMLTQDMVPLWYPQPHAYGTSHILFYTNLWPHY